MFRSTSLAFAVLALSACAEAGEQSHDDPGPPDASVNVPPDAPVGSPDAMPGADASRATPDAGDDPAADAAPDAMVDAAPDAAVDATPDAMVDAAPDAPDAGCTDTIEQLLSNADFDLGPGNGWVEQPDGAYDLITDADTLPVPPHSGNYAVWMGGAFSATDVLYQDVTIPTGATGLELAGYRWIGTDEDSTTTDFDTITVQIRDTSNGVLETLQSWGNTDASTSWTPFSLSAASPHAGQTVRLYLESNTDGTLNTNFFLDTFALRVTVCQ